MSLIPHPYRMMRRVDFCQTDAAGLMHFSSFCTYMEAAEAAVFRELGLRLIDSRNDSMTGFPRIEIQCKFRRPFHFDEEVWIEAGIEPITANRIHWNFRFFNAAGERAGRGLMVTAAVQRQPDGSLASIAMPDDILSGLENWRRQGG